ncbi:unnamed protein product [Lupinus luteus]|uniref:DUF3741 domain-containing protein n=1 Tax=Lupinus luteus TaxID=3873 RepID=A0AAV1XFD0_LUPLU
MGRDYWNWSGSRSSKSNTSRSLQTPEIPSGCMCALFHHFHFHPFHFSLNQQQQHRSSTHNILQTLPKGAEAPRNTLESQDGTISSISKDENFKVPKNIRTRTSCARGENLNDFSSEIISSPGTKTPTLVARLMGLDLLPDAVHSSSSSSSSCLSTPNQQGHHPHVNHHFRQSQNIQLVKHRNSTGSYNNGGIRSLHETPRSSDARPQTLPEQELQNQKPAPKCKKIGKEKFSSMVNKPQQKSSIRKKQEEAFVIRRPPSPRRDNNIKTKTKRTHPLPCNVLKNLNTTVSTLHPVKTYPSPPATKIPQKQVSETREPKWSTQLSICSSQRYKQEALAHTLGTQGRVTNDKNKSNGVSTTTEEGPEFQYISTILARTTVPHQWFSTFHPLDPSNFHQLELHPTYNSTLSSTHDGKDSIFTRNNQLGPRCNQRLLFDLIGQVLSEILVKPKYCNYDDGVSLLDTVWNKVRSFPRAKCEVLEDIDGLIEMKDEEEEGREREEGLVAEIEGNIFETLVHETVTVMVGAV